MKRKLLPMYLEQKKAKIVTQSWIILLLRNIRRIGNWALLLGLICIWRKQCTWQRAKTAIFRDFHDDENCASLRKMILSLFRLNPKFDTSHRNHQSHFRLPFLVGWQFLPCCLFVILPTFIRCMASLLQSNPLCVKLSESYPWKEFLTSAVFRYVGSVPGPAFCFGSAGSVYK